MVAVVIVEVFWLLSAGRMMFWITERVYLDVWVGSRAVKWSDQAPRTVGSRLGDVP
jgi:hypothetical protein